MSTAKDGGKKTAAEKVAPATGKLGVMVVGLGAVATTMIAGVEAVRRGLAKPIGSLTQMGTIRLGKRTDNKTPLVKDFVPLADNRRHVPGHRVNCTKLVLVLPTISAQCKSWFSSKLLSGLGYASSMALAMRSG